MKEHNVNKWCNTYGRIRTNGIGIGWIAKKGVNMNSTVSLIK